MKVLLDANVCIAVMRGHTQALARLSKFAPDECAVSTVVVYEFFTGVAKCREPERERIKVERLLSMVRVMPFDEDAAKHAAEIRAKLEKQGKVCGPYDLRLAGHALALGLTLATNNVAEFSWADGLQIEDWLAEL